MVLTTVALLGFRLAALPVVPGASHSFAVLLTLIISGTHVGPSACACTHIGGPVCAVVVSVYDGTMQLPNSMSVFDCALIHIAASS